MRLKELIKRGRYWQDRLNLREWDIEFKWGTGKGNQGECQWWTEELRATVYISKRCKEKEQTLIHELLHIVFEGHKDLERGPDPHLERALNRTANALYDSVHPVDQTEL